VITQSMRGDPRTEQRALDHARPKMGSDFAVHRSGATDDGLLESLGSMLFGEWHQVSVSLILKS
jgi:hypothetical protein